MTIEDPRTPNAPGLQFFAREEAAQIAEFGHVALARFTTAPPEHVYTAYREALERTIKQHPARASLIHIAEPSTPQVDRSQMIAELQKLLREYGDRLRIIVIVVVSGGFMSGALRSIVAGILMVTRPKTKIHVVGDLREACQLVASEAGGVTRGTLTRAAEKFREPTSEIE